MGGVDPAAMTAGDAGRRFRLASPTGALVFGGLVLALMIADVPLASLAHQSLAASGGSVPVWMSANRVVSITSPVAVAASTLAAARCSTRCGGGSSARWTGGSTGPAMTPAGR